MPDTRDVEESLRSLAADLEARSRPTAPAAAMARRAPVRRPRPRPGRVAVGVLAVVIVAVVAVGSGLTRSDGGGGGDRVETDQSPTPTPTLPLPANGEGRRVAIQVPNVPFADLPAAGFADVTGGTVVLYSLGGTELGRSGGWSGGYPVPDSDLVVWEDGGVTTVQLAPDPAQAPQGCDDAAGAGGTRLATCDLGQEIVRIDPTGASTTVAAAPRGYDWSRALPSPDGRWMLTEAADECGNSVAALGPTDGSRDPTTLVGDALAKGHAVGWLPDGRAVSQLVGGGCEQDDIPSRVLVTEPGGDVELPFEPRGVLHMWTRGDGLPTDAVRTLQRARRELGLEACCDGPLNGADVVSGLLWNGVRVSVTGGTQFVLPETASPGYHTTTVDGVEIIVVAQDGGGVSAELSCDGTVWHIGGVKPDVTDEDLVVAVAEALIPHLYCTVDPLPSG